MNPFNYILAIAVFGFGIAGLMQLFSGSIGTAILFFGISFVSGTIGGLLMKR